MGEIEFINELPEPSYARTGKPRKGSYVATNDGTSKVCAKCKQRVRLDEFYRWNRSSDGLQTTCKSCQNARLTDHHQRNPEKRKTIKENSRLKQAYGVTAEKYAEMLFLQGGVCYICENECSTGRKLAVDHNHETGEVRHLLCNRCNILVGHIETHSHLVDKVHEYLKEGGQNRPQ